MFVYELGCCGLESRRCQLTSDIAPILSKEFIDVQAAIECRFTLKRVGDMIIRSFFDTCFPAKPKILYLYKEMGNLSSTENIQRIQNQANVHH